MEVLQNPAATEDQVAAAVEAATTMQLEVMEILAAVGDVIPGVEMEARLAAVVVQQPIKPQALAEFTAETVVLPVVEKTVSLHRHRGF